MEKYRFYERTTQGTDIVSERQHFLDGDIVSKRINEERKPKKKTFKISVSSPDGDEHAILYKMCWQQLGSFAWWFLVTQGEKQITITLADEDTLTEERQTINSHAKNRKRN